MPMDNTVTVKVKADVSDFKKGFAKAKGEFKQMEKWGSRAFTAIKFGAAAAAYGLARFAVQATQVAIKGESMRRAFSNMAGTMSGELLDSLKKASKGTIAEISLIENANQAMLLGIDKSALPEMMEMARSAARATGQTVEKAFQDITTGIGRQSRMILDNLGIIVNVEKANRDYAESLGKVSSQLNEAEKKQAFLNAALAAGRKNMNIIGLQTETTADKVEKAKRVWSDFKESFGQAIIGKVGDTVTVFGELKDIMTGVNDVFLTGNKYLKTYAETMERIGKSISKVLGSSTIGLLADVINQRNNALPGGLTTDISTPIGPQTRGQSGYTETIKGGEKIKESQQEVIKYQEEANQKLEENVIVNQDLVNKTNDVTNKTQNLIQTETQLNITTENLGITAEKAGQQVAAGIYSMNEAFNDADRGSGGGGGSGGGRMPSVGAGHELVAREGGGYTVQPKGGWKKKERSSGGTPSYASDYTPYSQRQAGGFAKEGWNYLHTGEQVVPSAHAGGGGAVTINVNGSSDPEIVARAIFRKLKVLA